jgi:xanthine dehydrogenase accessory factor
MAAFAAGRRADDLAGEAIAGSLADVCLERQLANDLTGLVPGGDVLLQRYGRGSPIIDFRLPCGGGLDILLDPAPDRAALARTVAALDARQPASLPLALPRGSGASAARRPYIPPLSLILFGEGLNSMPRRPWPARWASRPRCFPGSGRLTGPGSLRLGGVPPETVRPDPWTAILLLFRP